VTLIAPGSGELGQILPPALNDDIVIFTDARPFQQCTDCPEEQWLDPLAMEQRLIALYGPGATGQIQPAQLQSFTFAELESYLAGVAQGQPPPDATPTSAPPPESPPEGEPPGAQTAEPTATRPTSFFVGSALERAEWVIFAMLQPEAGADASDALSLFLARRPDIARSARVIGFAFGAPYYLDTTEVSQLSAYFGLYSKTDAFVDAAVRALFLESPLRGRSPVDIEGVGYDLFVATQPDPSQVLELFIVDEGELKSPPSQEPLEVVPGATLRLQTGVIRDHNGNEVPDGSIVQFVQQDRIQGFVNVIADRPTVGGVANLDYLLEAQAGNFRITAVSGSAHSSTEVNIVIGENAVVSVNRPTPMPSATATATLTPTATATATLTPTVTPTSTPAPDETATPNERQAAGSAGAAGGEGPLLLGFLLGLVATAGAGYALGRNEGQDPSRSVRWMLWGLAGSLVAYNLYALGLGGDAWQSGIGAWAGLLTTLVGGLIGLALFYLRTGVRPQA
jgi:beta-N-acetylhexosaminidase